MILVRYAMYRIPTEYCCSLKKVIVIIMVFPTLFFFNAELMTPVYPTLVSLEVLWTSDIVVSQKPPQMQ